MVRSSRCPHDGRTEALLRTRIIGSILNWCRFGHGAAAAALASNPRALYSPRMTDEQQIGAVIDAMYAMISGPAGPRDWSRQAECFLPDARQVRTWVDDEGRPAMLSMGLEDYARNTQPFFDTNAFYEVETARRIDLFGNMAHVWSEYEARRSPGDEDVERRGINSIQLFRHPDLGWRIIHMIWDNERDPALEWPKRSRAAPVAG